MRASELEASVTLFDQLWGSIYICHMIPGTRWIASINDLIPTHRRT